MVNVHLMGNKYNVIVKIKYIVKTCVCVCVWMCWFHFQVFFIKHCLLSSYITSASDAVSSLKPVDVTRQSLGHQNPSSVTSPDL